VRYTSLSSGSEGNALVIEAGPKGRPFRLMVDCGLPLSEVVDRLALRELNPSDIDLVFVTHEHKDHVGGVARLARAHGIPVMATRGTFAALGPVYWKEVRCLQAIPGIPVRVEDVELLPLAVPHDAAEPTCLRVNDQRHAMACVTDLGRVTDYLRSTLQRLDAIFLEFNHDRSMLMAGPYPPALRERVGGGWGHINNDQAAMFLGELHHSDFQSVTAAHLSQKNNTVALVDGVLSELSLGPTQYQIASQAEGTPWMTLAT
jgi:phosphoribosyl 1,2-cyclic phosphodiesterase